MMRVISIAPTTTSVITIFVYGLQLYHGYESVAIIKGNSHTACLYRQWKTATNKSATNHCTD